MPKRLLLAACGALALAACSTPTPALSSFIAAETLDTAALAGLLVYEKLSTASPAVVTKATALQSQVEVAFGPLEAQAKANETIGDASVAMAAVEALVGYETANGINVVQPTTTGA